MSSNRYNRRTFVYSVAPYLREHSFDGLDLDWEYPKGSTDKTNFAELVKGERTYGIAFYLEKMQRLLRIGVITKGTANAGIT